MRGLETEFGGQATQGADPLELRRASGSTASTSEQATGWNTCNTTTLRIPRQMGESRGFEDGQLLAVAPDLSSRWLLDSCAGRSTHD